MTRTLLALTALLTLSLCGNTAVAQEVPEPRMMYVRGGVLCDTQGELETLLTAIHLANGAMPEEIPATCGRFVPRSPVPMMVTPLEWYQTPSVNTLIARFVYPPNGWTNYGWIAYEPVEDYVPEPDGNSL